MNFLKLSWRALLVVAVFIGVGLWVNSLIVHGSSTSSTPAAQIRLAALMGGLFAGGAAALLTILTLSLNQRK